MEEEILKKRRKKFAKNIATVAAVVVGVSLLLTNIYPLYLNISNTQKLEEYVQTEGTVAGAREETRYRSTGTGSRKRTESYTVYISVITYVVNGAHYGIDGLEYTEPERVGTKKEVFYNPENPEQALMKETVDAEWGEFMGGIWMLVIWTLVVWTFLYFLSKDLIWHITYKRNNHPLLS